MKTDKKIYIIKIYKQTNSIHQTTKITHSGLETVKKILKKNGIKRIFICLKCKSVFEKDILGHGYNKFCSVKCRREYHNLPKTTICPICSKEFFRHTTQKYCSRKCFRKFHYQQWKKYYIIKAKKREHIINSNPILLQKEVERRKEYYNKNKIKRKNYLNNNKLRYNLHSLNRMRNCRKTMKFTLKEWEEKVRCTHGFCPCCHELIKFDQFTLDHIYPITKTKHIPNWFYYIEDIQPLCINCNCTKNKYKIYNYMPKLLDFHST